VVETVLTSSNKAMRTIHLVWCMVSADKKTEIM
jgi:hypothetical protein